MPSQSSKPLRVCLHCYETLTAVKNHNSVDTQKGNKTFIVCIILKGDLFLGNAESSGEEDSEDDEDGPRSPVEGHDLVSGLNITLKHILRIIFK